MSLEPQLRTLTRGQTLALVSVIVVSVGVSGVIVWQSHQVSEIATPQREAAAQMEAALAAAAGRIELLGAADGRASVMAAGRAAEQAMTACRTAAQNLDQRMGGVRTGQALVELEALCKRLGEVRLERASAIETGAEAVRQVDAGVAQMTVSLNRLVEVAARRRSEAQEQLNQAQAASSRNNQDLHRLSRLRELVAQLRSMVDRPLAIDSRHRLNPLLDRVQAQVEGMRSELSGAVPAEAAILSALDVFLTGYADPADGLLARRRAQLVDLAAEAPRAAYFERARVLASSVETWLSSLAELADPLHVAVIEAERTTAASIATMVDCVTLEMVARDALLSARILADDVSGFAARAADNTTIRAFRQGAVSRLRDLRVKLGIVHGLCEKAGAVEDARQVDEIRILVSKVEPLLSGQDGLSVAVEKRVAAEAAANQSSAQVPESLRLAHTQVEDLSGQARTAQEGALGRMQLVAKLAIAVLAGIGALALLFGRRVARRVSGGILESEARDHAQAQRMRTMIEEVAGSAKTVSGASGGLVAASSTLAQAADASRAQSDAVAHGVQQVNAAVGSVATASEQMQATMSEIARQTSRAAEVARAAVNHAGSSAAAVDNLGVSSREIGKIVELIAGIAEQTNLLALNATIEAARAGDAGRGFAVVAGEVKSLAKQSGNASQDIARRISAIQADVAAATAAIGSIRTVVGEIDGIQGTIASAVEEQTATSREITGSLTTAAATCRSIAEQIQAVVGAVVQTAEQAGAVQRLADELSATARQLDEQVAKG